LETWEAIRRLIVYVTWAISLLTGNSMICWVCSWQSFGIPPSRKEASSSHTTSAASPGFLKLTVLFLAYSCIKLILSWD